MSRFRFSIATFLTVVTLLALGLAAMASQSRLATSLAYTAFLVLLAVASAGALLATPPKRAFWVGFGIFAWTYWFVRADTPPARRAATQPIVTAISMFTGQLTTRPQSSAPSSLLTAELMDWLESVMTANLSVGSKVTAQWRGGSYYTGTIVQAQDGQYLIVWDDGSPPQGTP